MTRKQVAPDFCSAIGQLAAEDPCRVFCHSLFDKRAKVITYSDLLDGAKRYASVYLDHGVRPGDVVLIILRHGPDLFYSFLGALLVAALPSFLPFLTPRQIPDLYWATHRTVFSTLGASLLVTWGENLTSLRRSIPEFSTPVHLMESTPLKPTRRVPEHTFSGPAFLQHSSGTTGLKKGVVITHESLSAQVRSYSASLGLDSQDRIATWLPLYHDMGLVACFLMPAMLGVPVVAMDPFEWVTRPAMLLDAVEEYRCTLAWLPNFAFHHICSLASDHQRVWDLSCVRAFIDCSEPCKEDTLLEFSERFGPMGLSLEKLHTCYALAENVFAASQSRLGQAVPVIRANRKLYDLERRVEPAGVDEDSVSFLSCGAPIDGVRVRILDRTGLELPVGHLGEIALSGESLFDGYYRNRAETDARLFDGEYRTRDLGFLYHGELFVTGRLDDILVVHGNNYYAHDIEFAVSRVRGVIAGRCVAIGEYQSRAGTSEVTVLAEADGKSCAPELKRLIKREVFSATGLVLRQVGLVPKGWLVKTTSGKISRVENLSRFRQPARLKGDLP